MGDFQECAGIALVIIALCFGLSACEITEHYVKKLDAETAAIKAQPAKGVAP